MRSHFRVIFRLGAVLGTAVTISGLYQVAQCRADEPSPNPIVKTAAAPQTDALWTDRVEPILKKNCFKCHGAEKQKGELDLRSLQAMLVGGVDGSVVIPGKPTESPLLQRIQSDADDRMPPEKDLHLSAEEILVLTQWIAALNVPGKSSDMSQGLDRNYEVPTLMELATQVRWSPSPGMQPSEAIDHLIAAGWKKKQISGTGTCDDATFVRRIYLDLVGRVPTVAEAESFLRSANDQKRVALVDELLAGQEYPRRMAELLDVMLLDRKGQAAESLRKANGWFAYLERSVAVNRPWNELVKELIVARPTSAESKGSQWFLYEQKNNHQQMAEAIAPIAFGVTIDCAQCHNHPLAHEIKQQNYWGLVAAFNRTTNADTKDGPALSESAIGGFVNFTNLKKESQPAILSLLNGKVVEEVRPTDEAKDSNDNYLVPPDGDKKRPRKAAVPKFSRRQAVADAIVVDNPLLARAFVNRIWGTLLGRGLVHPVNEMDSRHAPSHPELLSWLAQDFETSGYDIKRLIRNIVLTRTYQLKGHTVGAAPLAPELFAHGLEKPLSAEVLYRAFLSATGNSPDGTEELRQALITNFPALLAVEYNATLQQSAFLTNSPLIDKLLKPNADNLSSRLLALATPAEQARGAFTAILGRSPDEAEFAQAVDYLQHRQDRPEAAIRHLEWALLVSPEFLLNH